MAAQTKTKTEHPAPADCQEAADYAAAHGLLLVVNVPETDGLTATPDEVREADEELMPGQSLEWVAYLSPEEHAEAERQRQEQADREAREASRRPVLDAMREHPEALADALAELADMMGDIWIAGDVGPHMSCPEADAVAEVLRLSGNADAAATWLDGHARSDTDEEDRHRDRKTAPQAPPF